MEETQVRNLVKSWFDRARGEPDLITRFVFLWFCFNAWLAHESGEDRDAQMIWWLAHTDEAGSELKASYVQALNSDVFRRDLATLAGESPIGRTGRREGEYVEITSPEDFGAMLDGIYVVRCNLFHGAKAPNNLRDQKLVKVCGAILRKWVGNLVGSWRRAA